MKRKNWIGKNFVDWCKVDTADERKINYTMVGFWDGKEQIVTFTSDEVCDYLIVYRVRQSTIISVVLKNDEWYIVLNYNL